MAVRSVWCPVLGARVARVTDLEDETMKIVCAEYSELNGTCRLKENARRLGALSQLLERVSGDTLDTKNVDCCFCSR